MEFLDRIPAIICPDFFLVGPSPQYYGVSFLESVEPVVASFKFCSFCCATACFNFRFHFFFNQSLDTLLPAALRSLNSASKRLEVRGYLSVRWDLFPAILLLCLIGLVFLRHGQSQFCKNFAFVFSRLITSDLLTPCCFATVLYLSSKRSSVFFYEIDFVGLSLVSSPWIASLPLSLTLHNAGRFTLLTFSHSLHVCFT